MLLNGKNHSLANVSLWLWALAGFDDRDTDLFLCDTNTCKFDGECLRIGNMVTCICDFKVRPALSFGFLFSPSCFFWGLRVTLLLCHMLPKQWLLNSSRKT